VRLTLYVIPGSHPCDTVEAALRLKGLDYDRVDLMPGIAPFHQLLRFGRRTVPGLRADTYKVVGSPLILRALDGLAPEPALYPAESGARAAVEEAERWGDEQLQEGARWSLIHSITQDPVSTQSFLAESSLPTLPMPIAAAATRAVFRAEQRLLGGGVEGAERWARALPGLIDRVDELIADGTIGGETPNAADLQIAASVALMLKLEDLRPRIEPRPAGRLARRLFPHQVGSIPAGPLPAEWLADLPVPQAGGVGSPA
jgi:glutathione S-transferase